MKWLIRFTVLALALGIASPQTKKTGKTDAEISRHFSPLLMAPSDCAPKSFP